MINLTDLSDEMVDFLNRDQAPPLFGLPNSGFEVDGSGLTIFNQFFDSDSVFVGSHEEKYFAVVKGSDPDLVALTMKLSRAIYNSGSKEMSNQEIKNSLLSYCDWADASLDPWSYSLIPSSGQPRFDLVGTNVPSSMLTSSLPKPKKFLYELTSDDQETKVILDFLQAPLLKEECHTLGRTWQNLTISIP